MKKKSLLPGSAKGQSLVELAISLVILLFLLAGIVEFGLAFFQFVQLRDAAQEGALFG
jgi:Flp pilus assembly protein TadG